jgi:hypothetical protein
MKTRLLDTPGRRISTAVTVAVVMILVGGGIYAFWGGATTGRINGLKIVAAARAYTHALQESHAPVQVTVPLQTLIDKGFLKAGDVGALTGLDARIFLVAGSGSPAILMQVHMPDGSDLVLLDDGSVRQSRR